MACLYPVPANRDEQGEITLRRDLSEARAEDGQYLEIPCGSCHSCHALRVRGWAIRAHHESLTNTRPYEGHDIVNGCFITLTYADSHLPPDGSLNVVHWQNFAKKLRNHLGSFRYLHCGEYGSSGTKRPHYHAILFGQDFHEDRTFWTEDENGIQWRSEMLERCWTDSHGNSRGFSTLAAVNFKTASYVAGYVFKKLKHNEHLRDRQVETLVKRQYERPDGSTYEWDTWVPDDPIKPEYITMSRRPGLGTDWIEKNLHVVYPRDLVTIGNKHFHPPKFYDKILEKRDPELYSHVLNKRAEHIEEKGPTFPTELHARRANFRARNKHKNHYKRDKI